MAVDNVYVSNDADQEIVHFTFDRETGALSRQGRVRLPHREGVQTATGEGTAALRTTGAPLASSPDGRFLYAALRLDPCLLITYRIDADSGALAEVAQAPIASSSPFITTDRTGRFMLGAGYFGNLVWVSRVEPDGRVTQAPLQVIENIVTPHNILLHPNNRVAYVAATGHDAVQIYRFDETKGQLTFAGEGPTDPEGAATPRHLAFHPGGFLYAINETSGTIDAFGVDATGEILTRLQRLDPRSEEDRSGHGIGADLHLSRDGRFLYASERMRSTIAAIAVEAATGRLEMIDKVPAGRIPRSFQIAPSGRHLLAAGQATGEALVYAIDPATGRLGTPATCAVGTRPTWIEIVSLRD